MNEHEPKTITVCTWGADMLETTIPELRVSVYGNDPVRYRAEILLAATIKAQSIIDINDNAQRTDTLLKADNPIIIELLPSARLFMRNLKQIQEALLAGKELLAIEKDPVYK